MSVCYWGDQFYGINRITNPELFDEDKERRVIIESLSQTWDKEYVDQAIEECALNFGNVDELDSDSGADDLTLFLKGTGVEAYYAYCCNDQIMFFGISYSLPWQIEKIETQEEVNLKIYNALKPILKDGVTFEQVVPHINRINISGADDYITYYEL